MRIAKALSGGAALCILLVSMNAWAQKNPRAASSHTGDYLSVLMIGGIADVNDSSATGGSLEIRNDDDTIAALGVALGYNWAKKGFPVRSEIEYHYRFRFDYDNRITGDAGYENQLATHAVLVNAYYDWQINKKWAVFAGGGLGWAQNVSEVDRVPFTGGPKEERTDRSNNFAWNLAMGAIWSFSRNWDAEFRYRYIDLGEVEAGPYSNGNSIKADSYTSHDLIIGITYRF